MAASFAHGSPCWSFDEVNLPSVCIKSGDCFVAGDGAVIWGLGMLPAMLLMYQLINFLHHFSDDDGDSGGVVGEEVERSVCFCLAKGSKHDFPAMGSCSGLSMASAAADSFSGRWSGGRRWRIYFSPSFVAGMPMVLVFLLLCSCGGDGRCAWEAVYSTSSSRSKSSYAVSTMWTSSLHIAAPSSVPTVCSGQDLGRKREDPESGVCNLQIFQELFCNRAGMYCYLLI
ncbi:unnamed protein product [Urochloa humidicola]